MQFLYNLFTLEKDEMSQWQKRRNIVEKNYSHFK